MTFLLSSVKFSIFIITNLNMWYMVNGQGILLPSMDPYFCAPPGICPDSGGIDPRIITPFQDGTPAPGVISCPAGSIPCYAQGANSRCGVASTTSAADGDAPVNSHPWQAYFQGPTGAFIGSGSLISPYHVLTAAHKVLSYNAMPAQLTAIFGVNDPNTQNLSALPQSKGASISIYSPYSNATLKNDIAIVRLATPVSLMNPAVVNTICLPSSTTTSATYASAPYTTGAQKCVVSGWGQYQPTNPLVPRRLKQVYLSTTTIALCEQGFIGRVNVDMYLDKTGGQLCAGGELQKDACFQDGGGPLSCGTKETLAGIVIWGKSCGQAGVYGVYTNVPFYRSWIMGIITQRIP